MNNNDNTQEGHFIPLRQTEIGQGMLIKRALPNKTKRMIGAWCFLDHAGPISFPQGQGMNVGPHPHIGLQTFTWMIEGSVMHTDSLGSKQLIQPKQVNLMTAGYGISHTEVTPNTESRIHAAQLWIALPDNKRNIQPQFEHYASLPTIQENKITYTILVGDFLGQYSPVQVYSPLVAVDIYANSDSETTIPLNPKFEYAILLLEGQAKINCVNIDENYMFILDTEQKKLNLSLSSSTRLLLIGGEPFESPILLWWNYVGRNTDELRDANEQWLKQDSRFGKINDYIGQRLIPPPFPSKMRASK